MNKVILMGRLTRDPEIRTPKENTGIVIVRYTLAVDRRFGNSEDGQNTDYISCVAFGHSAMFAEKYLRKGVKVLVTGRIQAGSYTTRDGAKINTASVVVEEQEFAENKASGSPNPLEEKMRSRQFSVTEGDPWNIPESLEEEMPFH